MKKEEIQKLLLEIVYPSRCPLCQEILSRQWKNKKLLACKNCVEKLPLIVSPRCMKCGKQLESDLREYCQDCEKKNHIFERNIAVAAYSDELRESIHRYKYKSCREYTAFYGELLVKHCGNFAKNWGIDVILPIPMYAKKQKVRGYNQAELLAEYLGRKLGILVRGDLLQRCANTKPMKELNDIERLKNLQNAFKVRRDVVKYKRILLVDDIYTTGATMDACAKVLKQAGVEKVYGVSLCIGNGF